MARPKTGINRPHKYLLTTSDKEWEQIKFAAEKNHKTVADILRNGGKMQYNLAKYLNEDVGSTDDFESF